MIDPNVMRMISQMFGGSSGMANVLSPFSQMSKVINPMSQSQSLSPADEKSFVQSFNDDVERKRSMVKEDGSDDKKDKLKSLFKLFAFGGV